MKKKGNRNQGNGHLSSRIGLDQLGPSGGIYNCDGGDKYMIANASRVASKPHSISRRVTASSRQRNVKISLAKVEFGK